MNNIIFFLVILIILKFFIYLNNENFEPSCDVDNLDLSKTDFTYNYDKINNIFNVPDTLLESTFYAPNKKVPDRKPKYIDKYNYCVGRFSKISGLC